MGKRIIDNLDAVSNIAYTLGYRIELTKKIWS